MKKEILFDEVFDAQEQYRVVLNAMAQPGNIHTLSDFDIEAPAGLLNASAVIAFSLLNTDVSFHVFGNTSVGDYIALNTNAIEESLENADFIFINGLETGDILSNAKQGTLSYPENSATIIVDVAKISNKKTINSIQIIFKGPGIETENVAYVNGINNLLLQNIKNLNFEFPLGVDVIFTDENSNIVCLPRSNNFAFQEVI